VLTPVAKRPFEAKAREPPISTYSRKKKSNSVAMIMFLPFKVVRTTVAKRPP
jgi:hypothetical protein